ncbi:hypothetical protein COL23_25680 [Priestia aryabhattai]|nr:hypothetical protein COL23_25680 [Priestia aryabhattai]
MDNVNVTKIKRLLGLVLMVFVLCSQTSTVFAESPEDAAKNISVEEKKHGPYKDKTTYYTDLDAISYDELKEIQEKEEDKGFTLNPFNAISNYFGEKVENTMDSAKDMMASVLLMMVSLIFQFNIMMTDFLVTCLDASMNANIINFLITIAEDQVQSISGVSNNHINVGNGIFGSLAGLAGLISIAYMVYLFAIKRAPLASLQSLIQPLLVITISIVFFSNFTTIIKGVNSVSTELTNGIASATSEGDVDNIGDSIQKVFVHRPYLYLQFDSGNEQKIGKKRVEALLLHKQNAPEKRKAIKSEVKDHKNSMLEVGSVIKRLIYTGLFICVNGILSIPVWALAFLNVALQIWFLLIAVLAPFILVWAILPNQFPVMRRYAIELMYPMALKVIIGFLALVIFTFSQLAFAIPATKGLSGYYLSTFFQIVFFFVVFLMRNRIKSIFSATTGFVKEMRNSVEVGTQPIRNGIQNTAMVVGAGVGAATGNPHAAIAGAAIGKNLGKAVTGEKDALGTAAQLVSLQDIVQKRKEQGQQTTQPNPTSVPTTTSTSSTTTETSTETSTEAPLQEKEEQRSTPVLHDVQHQPETTEEHTVQPSQTSEEKSAVSSKYVPLQDLEDFKQSTNTEEQVKQKAVGEEQQPATKVENRKVKQEKLAELPETVTSVPKIKEEKSQSLGKATEIKSSEVESDGIKSSEIKTEDVKPSKQVETPSAPSVKEAQPEPSFEEIKSYESNESSEDQPKPAPLTKQQAPENKVSVQNIQQPEPNEEKEQEHVHVHVEETTSSIGEVGQRHKEDLKQSQSDLKNND